MALLRQRPFDNHATATSLRGGVHADGVIPGLLPTFLVRHAAFPTSRFGDACDPLVVATLRAWLLNRDAQAAVAPALSQILYRLVAECSMTKARRSLLHVRRSIHNLVPVASNDRELVLATVQADDAKMFVELWRLQDQEAALQSRLLRLYSAAEERSRTALKSIVSSEPFQNGLLLSSRDLFERVAAYLKNADGQLDGRHFQVERGLLRYASRATMKATPFATFCGVVSGRLTYPDATHGAELRFIGDPLRQRSQTSLNKAIFSLIWTSLQSRPQTRAAMAVYLNPTVHIEGDRWRYLTHVGRRELFKRIDRTAAVVTVEETARLKPGLSLRDLVNHILSDERIDATEDEASTFVMSLVDAGFLRLAVPVSESTFDWIPPLIAFLEPIDDNVAREVVEVLRRARTALGHWQRAGASERRDILTNLRQEFDRLWPVLEVSPLGLNDQLLFEDTTSAATVELKATPQIVGAIRTLQEYLTLLVRIAFPRPGLAELRSFFDQSYTPSQRVPLLTFYEDYHRERIRADANLTVSKTPTRDEASEPIRAGRKGPHLGLRIAKAREDLKRRIQEAWESSQSSEEIDISLSEVASVVEDIPKLAGATSVSIFFSVARSISSQVRLVTRNGCFLPGAGKYYSRFLYLQGEALLEDVRRANRSLTTDILAEVGSDTHFNANLHPPLVEHEITYPTNASALGSVSPLLASELTVACDPRDPFGLVLLRSSDNTRVLPLDLGFLTPTQRPPLYQLLSQFTPTHALELELPVSPLTQETSRSPSEKQSETVVRRPRICFGGSVIIARQRWLVPSSLLPQAKSNEAPNAYFLRINQWRNDNRIPERVYARVVPLEKPPHREENPDDTNKKPKGDDAPLHERSRRQSRDLLKPQFIDFTNPLLVQLFGKLGATASGLSIALEEELPVEGDVLASEQGRFVSEFMMQFSI